MTAAVPSEIPGAGVTPYEVVGRSCAIRPEPRLKSEPVGDIPQGKKIHGLPYSVDGTVWVRLEEKDASRYVPEKEERKNGCWVVQEHPTKGVLLRSDDRNAGGAGAAGDKPGSAKRLVLKLKNAYEAALELEWRCCAGDSLDSCAEEDAAARPAAPSENAVLEVVAGPGAVRAGALLPLEGAQVRRVPAGCSSSAIVQGLSPASDFLVAVCFVGAGKPRSSWLKASTLTIESRDQVASELQGRDPAGKSRGMCTKCSCEGYVPVSRRSDGISAFFNCRRCACHADCHSEVRTRTAEEEASMLRLVEEQEAERLRAEKEDEETRRSLREAEQEAKELLSRLVVTLPKEAIDWDRRERYLWFWSDGRLHPRENRHALRKRRPPLQGEEKTRWTEKVAEALTRGELAGRGKASVITPTTEARQKFHRQLWACFNKQTWPDKELIVIETYEGKPSKFFSDLDGKDDRLIFLSFKVPKGQDLCIGSKRNIGLRVAVGDYAVHFDDDDVYAPSYVAGMLNHMEECEADLVTLSSWYVFDTDVGHLAYCDPEEYAALEGKSSSDQQIDSWIWGYGFSYVYSLDPVLEGGIDFPAVNMSEDLAFTKSLRRHCGRDRAVLLKDREGLCLHVLHGGNQSASFCVSEVHRDVCRDLAFGEQFNELFAMIPRMPKQSRFMYFAARTSDA